MENPAPPRKRRSQVSRVIDRANGRFSMKAVAALLSGSIFLSAILGIYRDRLLNSMYFNTYEVGIDAYTAAFVIPDFMYTILVTGALAVSFIPVFNARMVKGNRDSAWRMSSSLLNLMGLVTLAVSVLIMIFAPLLVQYVVSPGLSEQGQALATSMMRVIAVNPFLFAIATVINSVQQAVGRFFFFALAPMFYNIGIIIGALFFTNGISIFGFEIFGGGIMGVALGVALGAALQLVVSTLGLIGLGFRYAFKIYWRNHGFRKVLSLLPPRSADQGLDYISSVVDVNLASRMGEGAIRAYNQATTLYQMPINLIGVAISTAAFPKMTERLGQGRPDLFRKELGAVLRVIICLALPVAAIMYFARGYVVSIIFREGNFIATGLFGIFALIILLRSVFHIASRSFYAKQDTHTPFFISLGSIVVAIGLALFLVFAPHPTPAQNTSFFRDPLWNACSWTVDKMAYGQDELKLAGYEVNNDSPIGYNLNDKSKINPSCSGPAGLAFAQVVWALLEVGALFVIMSRRIPKLFDRQFGRAVGRMALATIIMSFATFLLVRLLDLQFEEQNLWMVLPKLAVIGAISLAIYLGLLRLFKVPEAAPVVSAIKKVLFFRLK
jgi:putative peptidoglycan lipid II flippase